MVKDVNENTGLEWKSSFLCVRQWIENSIKESAMKGRHEIYKAT